MNQPPACGSAPKMRHIAQSQVELMLLRSLTLNRAVIMFGALCGGGEGVGTAVSGAGPGACEPHGSTKRERQQGLQLISVLFSLLKGA